jgi:hypothetical protein
MDTAYSMLDIRYRENTGRSCRKFLATDFNSEMGI